MKKKIIAILVVAQKQTNLFFFLFHLSIKTIHIQLIRKHTAAVMSIDFPYAW